MCILSKVAVAQSVDLIPNAFAGGSLFIKNTVSQPGLLHSFNGLTGPSIGTVIKSDGPYIQTFSLHALHFSSNNQAACMAIQTNRNVWISKYLIQNTYSTSYRKYTGFVDGYDPATPFSNDGNPNETFLPHGLDASKIISVKLLVNTLTGLIVGEDVGYFANLSASVSYDNTYLHVWNKTGESANILNKPFTILVTYQK
jgi:hypothetical protein